MAATAYSGLARSHSVWIAHWRPSSYIQKRPGLHIAHAHIHTDRAVRQEERASGVTRTINTKQWVTTGEASRRLGISRSTLLRAVQRGEIQAALRMPGGALRFDLADLDAYAQRLGAESHRSIQVPARRTAPDPVSAPSAAVDQGVAFFALDAAGTITACQGTLGFAAQVAAGQSIFEIYQDDPKSQDQVRRTLAGEAVTFSRQVRGAVVELRLLPQQDSAGTVTGLIGMATDVTALTATAELLHVREVALLRAEARARALLESAPDAIIVVDQDGHIVLANSQAERLFGYPRQVLFGRPIEDLLPEWLRDAHVQHRAQYQVAPQTRPMGSGIEPYARRHDGSEFPVEVSLSPLSTSGQQLVTAVIRDISARKAMEEELLASEARFRALTEHSSDLTRLLDADGTIRYASPSHQTVLGYDPAAVLGCNTVDFLPPEVVERARTLLAGLVAEGGRRRLVSRIRHADGTYRTFDNILDNQLDVPAVRGIVMNARDITERLVAEEAQARLAAIVAGSSDAIIGVNLHGTVTSWNHGAERLYGYTAAEAVGRFISDLTGAPGGPDRWSQIRDMLLRSEEIVGVETERRHRDGRPLAVSVSVSPIKGASGAVIGAAGIHRDISTRKAMEKTQAQLAAIVESSQEAIMTGTLDGVINSWNSGAEQLYGYSAAEAIGQSVTMLLPPDRPKEIAGLLARLTRGEYIPEFETERVKKGGGRIVEAVTISPVFDQQRRVTGMAVVARDITARKAAERAVEEARAFAEAMDRVSFALASTLEPDHLYQIILEQVMAVLPCEIATIFLYREGWAWAVATLGEPMAPIGTRLFPSSGPDRPWLATDHPGAVYLPDTDLEPRWVHIEPWVERRIRSVIGVPLRIEGEAIGAFQIHSRTPQRYEARHLALAEAFGARVVQALRNAHRFAEEQQRAREAEDFAQLQRDFLGIVSHELLSPITATQGLAQLLRKQWSTFDEAHRDRVLEGISAAAKRQHRLVEDLLDVSRAEAAGFRCERQPFALRPVLERATAEVQDRYAGQRIDLQGPDAAVAEADAGRTLQILVNVLDNAAKYSPEGNPVMVSWGEEAGQLVVRVRDYGLGIPEAGREQLFTRFGQLAGSAARAGRSGTGLGLYLSRLLARAMTGELDLESTGPHGTTFRLLLPSAPQP
jgi:PAS domain S-box-containing protein/excisionase family DNA binding protein